MAYGNEIGSGKTKKSPLHSVSPASEAFHRFCRFYAMMRDKHAFVTLCRYLSPQSSFHQILLASGGVKTSFIRLAFSLALPGATAIFDFIIFRNPSRQPNNWRLSPAFCAPMRV